MSGYCENPPDFYDCREVVGRNGYVCCECKVAIPKGERHCRATGKWDGKVETFRQHLACAEACELIRDEFGGECIGFGALFDEFEEMRSENWYGERDRYKPAWRRLRRLMAEIKRRVRSSQRKKGAPA